MSTTTEGVSPYYLLLCYDAPETDKGAIVCGTYRDGVDDPSKLSTAPAYVNVDLDDYRLARENGEWRFRHDRGLYKDQYLYSDGFAKAEPPVN